MNMTKKCSSDHQGYLVAIVCKFGILLGANFGANEMYTDFKAIHKQYWFNLGLSNVCNYKRHYIIIGVTRLLPPYRVCKRHVTFCWLVGP